MSETIWLKIPGKISNHFRPPGGWPKDSKAIVQSRKAYKYFRALMHKKRK